jgi:hypothetical protein
MTHTADNDAGFAARLEDELCEIHADCGRSFYFCDCYRARVIPPAVIDAAS